MRDQYKLLSGAVCVGVWLTACGGSTKSAPSTAATVTVATTATLPASVQSSVSTPGTTGIASSTNPAPATTAPAANPGPPASVAAGTPDPNAPEIVEPGDIPDNQVFVAYHPAGGAYSVKVPEGWARTESGTQVTFTDKYNSVTISSKASTSVPSVDAVKSNELTDVSADPTFHFTDVQPVTRKAGEGVLATFEIGSAPNAVTGKKALLAVERYVFNHRGTTVVLTLSGAKGADNIDPWKVVSDSLMWGQ